MHRLASLLREHLHFFIVVTLLTLVTTFPTIVYVFKTDVFWLPTGNTAEVFIDLWDIWYTKLILSGQADRLYTNMIYYPDGVSLAYDPKFLLLNSVVNFFQVFMPLSNAYCLTFLLLVGTTALAGYTYALWLFKDKWIGLLASTILAFSPQVMAHAHWPKIAWIWPIPVILYLVHRGISERRTGMIVLAGAFTGILTEIFHYNFVCLLISLALVMLALAVKRWRDRRFWGHALLLVAVSALSCAWRVLPMLEQTESLGATLDYYDREYWNDLVSFFVNPGHPILGPLGRALLQPPPSASISLASYLGLAPMLLIGIGLYDSATRRKMLPWLGLLLVFVILHLGSTLTVNGTVFEGIKLPKHYLGQILPAVFQAFVRTSHFMAGVCLPLAILACYGLSALRSRFHLTLEPRFVLLLLGLVAFEYYIPVPAKFGHARLGQLYLHKEPSFIDWLDAEAEEQIRLIHVPFGRLNSKIYYFYQLLTGHPQTEGAISRVPDSAYDYIRANPVLNAWHQHQPVSCELADRELYLSALAQLETDGFSHVVYHPDLDGAEAVKSSFRHAEPAYENTFLWIFRLSDLRHNCSAEQSASPSFSRAYADALRKLPILDDRHGIALVFPPGPQETKQFLRDLRHFARSNRKVMTVSSDEQAQVKARRPDMTTAISSTDLEQHAAIWLVNNPQTFDAQEAPAFRQWFAKRFNFCRRVLDEADAAIDLYLRVDIPCSAMDKSSEMAVEYKGGALLHNASYVLKDDLLHFYLAWTNATPDSYGFSLQFFNENGDKALQYDNVIQSQLLSTHEIDVASLPVGAYSIQLIVYDFETRASQGGFDADASQRFERELELDKLEVGP